MLNIACGLPDDGRLLIAVGRHHPEKRLDTVDDAVAHANTRRPSGLATSATASPLRAAVNQQQRKRLTSMWPDKWATAAK